MYTFEYTLDEKDYLEFSKFHYKPDTKETVNPKYFVSLIVIFLIFFSIGASGLLSTIPLNILRIISFSCLTLFILILILRKPIIVWSLKISIKNMKKKGRLPFGQNVRIQFDSESFHESTEVGETIVKYSFLEKITEGSHGIYVYFSAMQAVIIPHRAFETEQQKSEFLTFINGKVQSK